MPRHGKKRRTRSRSGSRERCEKKRRMRDRSRSRSYTSDNRLLDMMSDIQKRLDKLENFGQSTAGNYSPPHTIISGDNVDTEIGKQCTIFYIINKGRHCE